MIISYFGDGFFRVQNGETVIVVDPSNARQKAGITLYTKADPDALQNMPGVIALAGEYEIAGIDIKGWQLPDKKDVRTAYLVTWDDLRILFMGAARAVPDAHALETIELHDLDVLVVPTDPARFLPIDATLKFVRELEPSVVIPSHARDAQLLPKALGEKTTPQDKFVFKKKDLPTGAMRAIVLESR